MKQKLGNLRVLAVGTRPGCVNRRAWTLDNDQRRRLFAEQCPVGLQSWEGREPNRDRFGHGVRQEVSSDRSYRYIVVNFGACLTFLIDFHLFMQQTPSHFNFLNIISQFSIVFVVVLMDVALLPLLVKLFIQLLHLPKRKRRKKRNRQ